MGWSKPAHPEDQRLCSGRGRTAIGKLVCITGGLLCALRNLEVCSPQTLVTFARLRHSVRRAVMRASESGGKDSAPRWLPSLETLTSTQRDANRFEVLPCFPLPLPRAALPGAKRSLNVWEPRYLEMFDDLMCAGRRHFAVPRLAATEDGTLLAETAAVFKLVDIREAEGNTRRGLVCELDVGMQPVRLRQVLNPGVFADKSTHLRVECEDLGDFDRDVDYSSEERCLLFALGEIASLRSRVGDPLRRYERGVGAHGRPWIVDHGDLVSITEDSVGMADPSRTGLWRVADLWQSYCERRLVAMKQQRERDSLEVESSTGASELLLAREADAALLTEDTAVLMHKILQANSHGIRLQLLQRAAEDEAARLAAALAVLTAVGGKPPA
ncbi:unnamed protein product [Polarella glacialis]|uniref:Lon N-terminal domain-containing protein n=1 Tax=Polarella glacialis TaxID=89957 RepID=A0A813E0J7_POLGL|nr:unnamed protein product [Polarella glacialis]